NAKDYAAALEATNRGLEAYPGNALLLYNVACMSALLGDRETALTALAESVAKWEPYREYARGDADFESLRDEQKLVELVAASRTHSWSPSWAPRSKPRPYWKPEHPPPSIATRRTETSCSAARSSLIFAAAAGVRETMLSVRSTVAMRSWYPRRSTRETPD